MRFWIFILLLLIPIVMAYDSGETIEAVTLPKCFGEVLVQVVPDNRTATDYELVGCTKTKEFIWECQCNGAASIYLKTYNTTKNVFNFQVEYFLVRPTTADLYPAGVQPNKRMKRERVVVGVDTPEPKKQFQWPELSGGVSIIIIILISFVVISIIILIWMMFKFVMKDDHNKIEGEINKEAPYKIETPSENSENEELDQYLKGL